MAELIISQQLLTAAKSSLIATVWWNTGVPSGKFRDSAIALVQLNGRRVSFNFKELKSVEPPVNANGFLSGIHGGYQRAAGAAIPVIAITSGLTFAGGFELAQACDLAEKLASQPGFAIRVMKKAVDAGMDTNLASALAYESRCFALLFSTRDKKRGLPLL